MHGNFSYSTFGQTVTGAWNYELGDTTMAGDSDRLLVNGTATINAASASDVIHLNVMPVEGTLSPGDYALVQANSLSVIGSASNSTYRIKIFDAQGNDITADIRQTASVANSVNNVVLNVSDTSANLNWAGTAGNAWDVDTTGNWTGTGGPRFKQLDNVTFGNVANKNVTINTHVVPGSVTFDGGGGSTYIVTGSGGITGFGPVHVHSGTVQLKNAGNNYAGATTIASGARLEVHSASTGDVIINGTLSIGGVGVATGGPQTFYSDDLNGVGGVPLNGTTPDTSFDGSAWVAAATFENNGDSVNGTAGGSATLAFTPIDGSTYRPETSIQNVFGDTDWFALGFASGQSTDNSSNARFITGTPEGLAWALYRGDASTNANQTFLGDTDVEPNSGLASGREWLVDANMGGGDIAIRLTLDTTGGAGNWTVTMEADTGGGFQTIRATEVLLDEAITSVGIANSNTADLTGMITSFSLTTDIPTADPLEARTLTVEGDFTLDPGATLEMDLFDTDDHDHLSVFGALNAGGTLVVSFTEGAPSPVAGDTFDLIEFGAFVGNFESIALPALDDGLLFEMIQNVSSVTLRVRYAADFDADGDVDGDDFLVWQASFGVTIGGDADGDQDTDGDDFLIRQAQYGSVAGTRSTAVPEPSTMIIGSAMAWILGIAAPQLSTQRR
ncbi:MAG: hypothetical protein JW829_01240 [Pirellulales bacterium]|nr:hypothetical protein [Pirellulales bacterium]